MEEIVKRILNQNEIKFDLIKRAETGFSNVVYLIDDKYVIKFCDDKNRKARLKKEIDFYKNNSLDFIPKYIVDGEIDNFCYLIIEQFHGRPIYKVWHLLKNEERKNIVKQMARIFKCFHKSKFDFLPENKISHDWLKKWQNSFALNISILNKKGFDTSKITNFAEKRLPVIFKQQKLGLVYNDAHFDNFILCDNKLKLIDFDRILYGSIDYELLVIQMMVDNPAKLTSEQNKPNIKPQDYVNIMKWLKHYYPKLFRFKLLNERVFVYQFIYNLGNAYFNNRNDWIEKEIKSFETFFNL